MLRNGSTPVTSCTSQATRLRELPNRGCPSRPELAPRAELACRARSRGQRCHSVDLTADASSPVSINMHLWWSTRPAVLRSRRLATACMIPSSWPAPDGCSGRSQSSACVRPQRQCRTTPFVRWLARVALLLWRRSSTPTGPQACALPRPQSSRRHWRTAASARRCRSRAARGGRHPPRYCFLCGIGPRPPGPEQSSRLDRPRDRFARNPIVSSRDPDESFSLWDQPTSQLCSGDDQALRPSRRQLELCHENSHGMRGGLVALYPRFGQRGRRVWVISSRRCGEL